MKICLIAGSYPKDLIGGAELQTFLIGRELSKLGHDVYYLAINTIVNKPFFEIDEGINVYRIRKYKNRVKYFARVYKLFRMLNIDVCYNRTAGELPVAFMMCKLTNTPLVYAIANFTLCHPSRVPRNLWRPRHFLHNLFHCINQSVMHKVETIIVQSEFQHQLLRKYISKDNVVIKHGCPVLRKVPIKEEPPIVIWVGNLKPIKRPELFIRLAEQCIDLNCKFIMAGYLQSNRKYYHDLLKEAQKLPNIEYIGGVSFDESNDWIGRASILVNTTVGGISNTLVQAWMSETPTVNLTPDPDDVLKKYNLGFHSKTFEQMVKDVKFLIENKTIREEMGKNARKYAIKEHNIQNVIPKYIELFENL